MNGLVAEATAPILWWSFVREFTPASGARHQSVHERALYVHQLF
jgi:hypothetical protein